MPKNENSAPERQTFAFFLKMMDVSELSHQYASNKPSMTFQSCFKLKLCLLLCFGLQMLKYGNSAPDPQIFAFFWKWSMFQNCPVNTLPTSPQWNSNHVANSNYAYFCVLGPKCPNMEIRPQNPKFSGFFLKRSMFWNCLIHTLPTSPQWLSEVEIKSKY